MVRFDLGAFCSRSNDGSLALVSCLSSGYKFALVLRCVGLVDFSLQINAISLLLNCLILILCLSIQFLLNVVSPVYCYERLPVLFHLFYIPWCLSLFP